MATEQRREAEQRNVPNADLKRRLAQLNAEIEEAGAQFDLLDRQSSIFVFLESIEGRLAAIDTEIQAIGALARDHDEARAALLVAEERQPEAAERARAVFAIMHHTDRYQSLVEELSEATRRRDEQRKLLAEATRDLSRAREAFDESAMRRAGWFRRRPAVNPDRQWVIVERLTTEIRERTAAIEVAEALRRELEEETEIIDEVFRAFQEEHGAPPWTVYDEVNSHRLEARRLRREVPRMAQAVQERRALLDESLRDMLLQLRGLGLVSAIPDGIEMKVSAVHQACEVAELETALLDPVELEAEANEAARRVVVLNQRLEELKKERAAGGRNARE